MRRDGSENVTGIGQTQLLLLVGICWVPLIMLGIFGFAAVLRKEGRASASLGLGRPVQLGTLQLESEGQLEEVGFQWFDGGFVAEDGQPLLPTVVAELDAQDRVQWASEEQRVWFRRRYVEHPEPLVDVADMSARADAPDAD